MEVCPPDGWKWQDAALAIAPRDLRDAYEKALKDGSPETSRLERDIIRNLAVECRAGRYVGKARRNDPFARITVLRAELWELIKLVSGTSHDAWVAGNPKSYLYFLRIFPADVKSKGPATAKAISECRDWLIALMLENPESQPKEKPEYLKDALGMFSGLTKRGFERAWEEAKEKTKAKWGKRGPRPDLSQKN